MTIHQFGNEVRDVLRRHLEPGKVTFLGSFASGKVDEYSDVDLEVNVQVELTQGFFDSLAECLRGHFGPLSVRYDPQQKTTGWHRMFGSTFTTIRCFGG